MASVTDFSKYKVVDIVKCVKAAWNYKQENEVLTQKLIENLKRNGQVENILVRELDTGFYEVINGNHRLDAMNQIGSKKIIVYDLGKISLTEAKRLTIETNETKFSSDQVKLAEVLHELSQSYTQEELLETLPYNQQDVENYIKIHTFTMDDFVKSESQSSGETGARGKAENTLFLTLSQDALPIWKDLKSTISTVMDGASDYDIFLVAISYLARELDLLNTNFDESGLLKIDSLVNNLKGDDI